MRTFFTCKLALLVLLWPLAASAGTNGRVAPDFVLIDQHGRPFELSHLRGHPIVLFFGYAHCPDECPTVLANLARARRDLGPLGADVTVAMITVDPDRDSGSALGRFVALFDPAFLGLRGARQTLRAVYRAYDVKYVRQAGNPDYAVAHSTFVFYIGRGGRIDGLGSSADSREILEQDLAAVAAFHS